MSAFNVEKYFDSTLEAAEQWNKRVHRPRFVERVIETDVPISITFTSDWHIGSPGTAHRQLRADMQQIANNPRMFAYVGGDWANNFIVPGLMNAGLGDIFPAGDPQMQVALYITQPLFDSHSVLAVGEGNHDGWLRKLAQLDPLYTTFGDVPDLHTRDGSLMTVHVGNQQYRIFRRHRPRWSSALNPAHSVVMEYQRNPFDFDIGVIEHQHQSHGADFEGKMREDGSTHRIAIRPGTYKLEDKYADEHGFYYASSVQQSVILWPDKFQMLNVRGLDLTEEILAGL